MSFGHHNEHNKASYYKARKEPDSIIPPDILQVFEENDIPKVWSTLDKVFHLNVKHWKLTFEYEVSKAPREVSKQEVFYRFCKSNFEKPINVLRGNSEYEPVMEKVIRYVIRAKIAERKKDHGMYSYPGSSKSYNKR
jgi:hypothetical protein